MKLDVQIVTGPQTSRVSKEVAEEQLRAHPQFPKKASVTLEEVEGRWVAAIATAKETKKAEKENPFGDSAEDSNEDTPEKDNPFGDESSDETEEPEAGETEEHEESETPAKEKSEHKPKKEKKDKEGDLGQILDLLNTLLTALGISPAGPAGLPVGGEEEAPPAPAPSPEGIPGAPSDDGGAKGEKSHMIHERALKPGEAPPGTTPIGAPSFSSVKVADDHPWKEAINVKRSFPVEEVIGNDESLASVKAELDALAEGTGYKVKQLVEGRTSDGKRTAKALISR